MKKSKVLLKIGMIMLLVCIMTVIGGVTVSASNQTTEKSAVFSIKKHSSIYYGNEATGKYLFELPVLKGKSKAVRKINASLRKLYEKSLIDQREIKDITESSDSSHQSYYTQYFSTTTCKATYNKKGIVSFCFHTEWYAGGVANTSHYGASYNLKTGKKLGLYDVISGTRSKVKEKIASKMAKKYAPNYSSYYTYAEARNKIKSMQWSRFGFYLKNGKVIVSTGSYGPLGGHGEIPFKFEGDY